ncbi:MAG: hypothetical protein RBT76_13775 [candidate division Zixibacteria bacterium]|jgi:vacuolar-type H+-ATPase subunit I/STV1|nr:hypothetical protein [candidate division Zixibacteria bacterium]
MNIFGRSMQLPDPEKNPLPDEQEAVLDKVAFQVVKRGMTVPAIVFLESIKPLNYIGSQAMVFFEPIVQTVFNWRDYDALRLVLERRESIEILIQKVEAEDAVFLKRERAIKKYYKEQKKSWKWYQRWFGIRAPRVELPDEIKNMPTRPESVLKRQQNEKSGPTESPAS